MNPWTTNIEYSSNRFTGTVLRTIVLACLTVVLLWPAIWNRGPFYFLDTRTYMRSVDAAINKLTHKRSDWTTDDDARPGSSKNLATASDEQKLHNIGEARTRSLGDIKKKGIMVGRSLYWGLLLYAGSITGGFWLTVVLQSAGFLLCFYLLLRTLRYPVWLTLVFVSAGLALLSDVAFFTSFLLPDVFVGFAIVGCTVLIALQRQLARKEYLLWFLFLWGALLCHDACILIAISLLGAALIGNCCLRNFSNWRGLCVILLAVIAASAGEQLVAIAISRVAGQAPLRFPLVAARLVADGPGTHYLRDTCPQNHFVLCDYVSKFPLSSDDFLFGTDPEKSVYETASIQRRRELSAQQFRFLFAVLRYDPAGVMKSGLVNTWDQLVDFPLSNFNYDPALRDMMERTFPRPVLAQIRASAAYRGAMPVAAFSILVYLFVLGSLAYLLFAALGALPRRSMSGTLKRMFLWVLVAMILNAAIDGGISLTQARYQARVVWIIPLIALLVESQRWIPRREDADSPPGHAVGGTLDAAEEFIET